MNNIKKIITYCEALKNREDILQEILVFMEKYKNIITEETKKEALNVNKNDIVKKQTQNSKVKREKRLIKPPNPKFNVRRYNKKTAKLTEKLSVGYIYEGGGDEEIEFDSMDDYMQREKSGELDELFGENRLQKYTFKIKIT